MTFRQTELQVKSSDWNQVLTGPVGPVCEVSGSGSELTDGAGSVGRVLLQEPDDLGLLSGGAAAADHGRTLTGQLHELVLVVPQTHLQRDGDRTGTGQGQDRDRESCSGLELRTRCLPGCSQYLQRVSRDDQSAVVFPPEGVELQVGLSSVRHLLGGGATDIIHRERLRGPALLRRHAPV